eukprot:c6120_g1_i3.p1 GENE.c6120_g1_i3~~c6120_g1_i3.p1  ORF type:complete len:639 (+),score=133.24 c6120_g1_i3:151-1917(+)
MRDDIPATVWGLLITNALESPPNVANSAADAIVEVANALAEHSLANQFALDTVPRLSKHVLSEIRSNRGTNIENTLWTLLQICVELPPVVIVQEPLLQPIITAAFALLKSSDQVAADAAMFLLSRLNQVVFNFPHPPPLSVDVMCSTASEPNQCAVAAFTRSNTVFSLCGENTEDKVNVVVRDCTAKHCWAVSLGDTERQSPSPFLVPAVPHTATEPTSTDVKINAVPLEVLAEPGTMGWEETYEVSDIRSDNRGGEIVRGMQSQTQWWRLHDNHPFVKKIQSHQTQVTESIVTSLHVPESSFIVNNNGDWLAARALAGHFLRLARPDLANDLREVPFSVSAGKQMYESVSRHLKLFDQARSRECHKIGVIYAAAHHEDQSAMLKLQCGSQAYRAFIDGLGWQVPLSCHNGFNGKLDRNQSTGTHAPYFADSLREALFHVTSQMPTDPNDPQQINKKRHVGNDQVQIVYSEHDRDYRPETISTQFNDAHIIVYPISGNRYRIQTYSKKDLVFGPLCDGMIVHASMVSVLVRRTAVNADCLSRYTSYGHKKPFLTRKLLLQEISTKTSLTCPSNMIAQRIFEVEQPNVA